MKNVYAYLRVSTLSQKEKYGLDVQEEKIRDYCENNDLYIKKIFIDTGITGANEDENKEVDISKRTGFLDMLEELGRDNDVDMVIVHQTSRLWRDEGTHVFVARELMKRKIKIYSIKEPFFDLYTTDPSAAFCNAIIAALDVYERMTINVKLASGRATKARKHGVKPGGTAPYGYQYDINKNIVVDNNEAEIVKIMFSMAREGEGWQKIADFLNEKGYRNRAGNEWLKQTIRHMVQNDFYMSVLTHNEKRWGVHQAIVSKEEWQSIHPEYDFSEILE